jgi:hypothetical protein
VDSVSCGSATSCTAIGQNLAEHWDGNTWTVQPTPSRNPFNDLVSVSCPTATSCTAVGQH